MVFWGRGKKRENMWTSTNEQTFFLKLPDEQSQPSLAHVAALLLLALGIARVPLASQ